jgi:hypothetical protein
MSNKEELEKIITLIEPYSKGNEAIEAIIGTITIISMKENVSDAEKDKIYTDITNVLSDPQIKTILDEFSKIKDLKIKEDKVDELKKIIEDLEKQKDGETDQNKLKEIDSLLDIANFKKNVILKLPDPDVKPASTTSSVAASVAANPSTVAANPSTVAAIPSASSTVAAKPSTASSAAVLVYVKIGADNSIEILDSIPASATLTNSSFYDIIKNDITSDTYIAMDITETCSNVGDDSCIQYNGTDYSMDLQNMGTGNQPLDMNFLKVKASATNASSPLNKASAPLNKASAASNLKEEEGVEEGEEEVGEEEGEEEVEEEEGEEEVEEEVGEETEEEKINKIKKIKENEEINTEWEKFKDLVNKKIDSLNLEEEKKNIIIVELRKIENEQINTNINRPNDLLKNIKIYTDSFIKNDFKDYFDIIDYLEKLELFSPSEEVDGGMSMNISH